MQRPRPHSLIAAGRRPMLEVSLGNHHLCVPVQLDLLYLQFHARPNSDYLRMWLLSGRCYSRARLDGKTAVVTGANCGIGKSTALDFVRRGARVVLACRDVKKAKEAADDIRRQTKSSEGAGVVEVVELDLASLASVRQCAQYLLDTQTHIHILVNNAGVCYCPKLVTEDGFDMHMGVNHLGHFLLTCLLLPRIIRSGPARIVNVASINNYVAKAICFDDLHWEKRRYNNFASYSESKLANVLFSAELSRRLKGTGVNTYSLHPGIVVTEAARHVSTTWFPGSQWIFENVLVYLFKTCEQGAQTSIHCAVCEETAHESGLYYRMKRGDSWRIPREPSSVRAQTILSS
ncbi:retinol dehydrogenase 12-like isoform X2 [Periplaneta americana]|uniref:retinol dehydrogenase 12-like isoform X2 n=1 Tax=Periplaneta americana TaxID=6978 RepID=UPI0037E7F870